jgi:Zn-dependent M16 (insulinase) family peptidase
MNDGNFIRIIYSTPIFTLNGIYLSININHLTIEKYYNKFKCSFDTNLYKDLIDKLQTIENNIIKKINIRGKIPQYKIYEQLKNGNIKIFSEDISKINNTFLLKIAGIWETDMYYGLTYKFIKL